MNIVSLHFIPNGPNQIFKSPESVGEPGRMRLMKQTLKLVICFLGLKLLGTEYPLSSSNRSNGPYFPSLVFPKGSCSKYLLAGSMAFINVWPSPWQWVNKGKM